MTPPPLVPTPIARSESLGLHPLQRLPTPAPRLAVGDQHERLGVRRFDAISSSLSISLSPRRPELHVGVPTGVVSRRNGDSSLRWSRKRNRVWVLVRRTCGRREPREECIASRSSFPDRFAHWRRNRIDRCQRLPVTSARASTVDPSWRITRSIPAVRTIGMRRGDAPAPGRRCPRQDQAKPEQESAEHSEPLRTGSVRRGYRRTRRRGAGGLPETQHQQHGRRQHQPQELWVFESDGRKSTFGIMRRSTAAMTILTISGHSLPGIRSALTFVRTYRNVHLELRHVVLGGGDPGSPWTSCRRQVASHHQAVSCFAASPGPLVCVGGPAWPSSRLTQPDQYS